MAHLDSKDSRMDLLKPSPAMLVALLALFVALGGTSYAVVTLSKNSVKSKHIAKGAVKRADIAKGAVNSAKVANGSLLGADFAAGQLPAGPKGDKGDKGDRGETGAVGISNHEVVLLGGIVQPTETSKDFTLPCPAGKKVLGGGVATFNKNIQVMASTPVDNGTTWAVTVEPDDGATFGGSGGSSVNIRIVCANVEEPAP